jgi:RHS repeat-associated protein
VTRSTIKDNSLDGLRIDVIGNSSTSVTGSEITGNGQYAMYFQSGTGNFALASATGNNIYGNGGGGRQIWTTSFSQYKNDSRRDWRGNYWGDNVYYYFNRSTCASTGKPTGKLAYRESTQSPPAGPMDATGAGVTCGADKFTIGGPDGFSPVKLAAGAQPTAQPPSAPEAITLGPCDGGVHARNPSECMSDPVNSATGSFTQEVTDASLPGVGVPFVFERVYNSLDVTTGELGAGWTDSYAASLTFAVNGDATFRAEDGQKLLYVKQQDGSFLDPPGALSTLSSVTGGYELVRHDSVRYRFDTQGRLTSIKDQNGQGVTLAYGANGTLSSATDAAGRVVSFAHDANSLLTGISLPDGRAVSYGYTNGLLTSVTDLRGKVWTYTYDVHGFLEKAIDPLGHTVFRNVYADDGRVTDQYDALNNRTTFAWNTPTQTATVTDARGNAWKDVYQNNILQKRIDALGNETQFGHDPDLNKSSVTAPGGSQTTMGYDARGNLTRITAPASLGAEKTFVYDANNRLTSVTDARGKVASYEYDAAGNTTKVTLDGLVVAENTYDSAGKLLTSKDARGNTTTNSYDANGNLASTTDPAGDTTTFTYNDRGFLTKKVAPRGNVPGANPDDYATTYTYDATGHLLTETDPLGHTTTHAYDDAGNDVSVTDANNHQATKTYDAANRLTSVTTPSGAVTSYTYDAAGNKASETDPNNHTTTYSYDADNRLVSETSPLGDKRTFAYDAKGNLVKEVDPRGNVQGASPDDYATTFTYDAAGRVLTETDPLGHATTHTYDVVGNELSVTDANGHTTSYAYDGKNRVSSVTAPDGGVTSYAYDGNGNVLTATDDNGHTQTYTYDVANRPTSRTLPQGKQWTYNYDADGNLTTLVDANGNSTPASEDGTTSYAYNRADRLTAIDHSDSTPDVQFIYDSVGNRASMADGAGTQTYAYDASNRVTSVSRGTDTFSYTYDAGGNITQRTYPDGTVVDYGYDADERLSSVTNSASTTTYVYDSASHLTQTTLPATTGLVETRAYDHAGRLTDVTTTQAGSTATGFAYSLDAVGNPTQVIRTGTFAGTETYDYDAADRLIGVCHQSTCPNGSDPFVRWTYDKVGNRLTETRPSGTTNYTYDAADELISAGPMAYSHDANGNQTSAGDRSFAYDLENRLASTRRDGAATTYSYDGDGNRIGAASSSGETRFLWDTTYDLPQLAIERDASGNLLDRYVYGLRRLKFTDPSSTSYYAYDALGSVANVLSGTGEANWSYAYDPFGALRLQEQNNPQTAGSAFKFTGEYQDVTGLYDLRARDYDGSTGRFLQRDPAGQTPDGTAISTYLYGDSRPTVMVDPSGLTFTPTDDGVTSAIQASSPSPVPCLPIPVLHICATTGGGGIAIPDPHTGSIPKVRGERATIAIAIALAIESCKRDWCLHKESSAIHHIVARNAPGSRTSAGDPWGS